MGNKVFFPLKNMVLIALNVYHIMYIYFRGKKYVIVVHNSCTTITYFLPLK